MFSLHSQFCSSSDTRYLLKIGIKAQALKAQTNHTWVFSLSWTLLELLGKCVLDVHIVAHWCICQIHRPLLMFLSLRTNFINTLTQDDPSVARCDCWYFCYPLPLGLSHGVEVQANPSEMLFSPVFPSPSMSPPAFGGEPCAKPRLVA